MVYLTLLLCILELINKFLRVDPIILKLIIITLQLSHILLFQFIMILLFALIFYWLNFFWSFLLCIYSRRLLIILVCILLLLIWLWLLLFSSVDSKYKIVILFDDHLVQKINISVLNFAIESFKELLRYKQLISEYERLILDFCNYML